MLVLRRKEGEWVEVTHSSGDVIRIQVANVKGSHSGSTQLVFDDPARRFDVVRSEVRDRADAQPIT